MNILNSNLNIFPIVSTYIVDRRIRNNYNSKSLQLYVSRSNKEHGYSVK